MVANPDTFLIISIRSSVNNNNIIFIVENKHIKINNEVKLFGITVDHKLIFTTPYFYKIQKQFMQYSQ